MRQMPILSCLWLSKDHPTCWPPGEQDIERNGKDSAVKSGTFRQELSPGKHSIESNGAPNSRQMWWNRGNWQLHENGLEQKSWGSTQPVCENQTALIYIIMLHKIEYSKDIEDRDYLSAQDTAPMQTLGNCSNKTEDCFILKTWRGYSVIFLFFSGSLHHLSWCLIVTGWPDFFIMEFVPKII